MCHLKVDGSKKVRSEGKAEMELEGPFSDRFPESAAHTSIHSGLGVLAHSVCTRLLALQAINWPRCADLEFECSYGRRLECVHRPRCRMGLGGLW